MGEASLHIKEFSIESVDISVTCHHSVNFSATRSDADLHSIRTVRIGRHSLIEFPGASLMTIDSIEKRPGRTDLDTISALGATEPSAVGADHCVDATVTRLDRVFSHPFVTDSRATLA